MQIRIAHLWGPVHQRCAVLELAHGLISFLAIQLPEIKVLLRNTAEIAEFNLVL